MFIFQARNLEASSIFASGGVFAASEAGGAAEEGGGQARQDPRLRLQLRAEQLVCGLRGQQRDSVRRSEQRVQLRIGIELPRTLRP